MVWLSLRRASAGMSVDGSGCFCCGESGAGMGVDGNGCEEKVQGCGDVCFS